MQTSSCAWALAQLIRLYAHLSLEQNVTIPDLILGSVQRIHGCEHFFQGASVASDPVLSSINQGLYGALVRP